MCKQSSPTELSYFPFAKPNTTLFNGTNSKTLTQESFGGVYFGVVKKSRDGDVFNEEEKLSTAYSDFISVFQSEKVYFEIDIKY